MLRRASAVVCARLSSLATPGPTGGFELTFLGTSSQLGKNRYPSSMALRLHGQQVFVFDAGEGTVAQLQRSQMRVGLVRNIFITHLHGDHLYGLPGLVLACLACRKARGFGGDEGPLVVYGPQGVRAYLRLALGVAGFRAKDEGALRVDELVWPTAFGSREQGYRSRASRVYTRAKVRRLSFELPGRDILPREAAGRPGEYTYHVLGGKPKRGLLDATDAEMQSFRRGESPNGPAVVTAAPVLHTIPTFAFSVTENMLSQRFDKDKLKELKIPSTSPMNGRAEVRNLFRTWLSGQPGEWDGQSIHPAEVLQTNRQPRSVCVVGDTYDASGAAHIARGVDVLVHEATNLANQSHISRMRGHSSTRGATGFAKRIGAKRLVLNHTSVAYSENKIRLMEREARVMLGSDNAFVARDLSVFSVPTEDEDVQKYMFRRFVGYADSLEFKGGGDTAERRSPFGGEMQSDVFCGRDAGAEVEEEGEDDWESGGCDSEFAASGDNRRDGPGPADRRVDEDYADGEEEEDDDDQQVQGALKT